MESSKSTLKNLNSIALAPMEGVINAPMRQLMTSMGGFSRCVTEFVRVTNVLLPERVFLRLCPELLQGGRTDSGVPVYVQLLGSDPTALALNAVRAVNMGALGVDLNFGCPAKTVNNSMGGSILLREPFRVASIVAKVRDQIPTNVPLTVKIRLGYDNADALGEIVGRVWEAGASELVIHARTKFDGYKPPAWWSTVAPVTPGKSNRTYINGEIWTIHDAHQACIDSGCQNVMLGRGALAMPDLASQLRATSKGSHLKVLTWSDVIDLVEQQFLRADCQSARHVGNRTKQWLAYLKRNYPEAESLFKGIRTLHTEKEILAVIKDHRLMAR